MITITGLTPKQKVLLDIIWGIDSMEKVEEFISTLPHDDARDAKVLVSMAIYETIDQQVQTLEDCPDSCRVIQSIIDNLD